MKKTMSINDATILAKVFERRKVEYQFFNLSLNKNEHQVNDIGASQTVQVFLVFAGKNYISGKRRATNEQEQNQVPLIPIKKQLLR